MFLSMDLESEIKNKQFYVILTTAHWCGTSVVVSVQRIWNMCSSEHLIISFVYHFTSSYAELLKVSGMSYLYH